MQIETVTSMAQPRYTRASESQRAYEMVLERTVVDILKQASLRPAVDHSPPHLMFILTDNIHLSC